MILPLSLMSFPWMAGIGSVAGLFAPWSSTPSTVFPSIRFPVSAGADPDMIFTPVSLFRIELPVSVEDEFSKYTPTSTPDS